MKVNYPTVSIVVPVYNGEQSLELLVSRLIVTLEPIVASFEIILINDCSEDGSWHKICFLSGENPCVKGMNLMRNYGQHNALLAGIRCAKKEIIITIDDDLQNPPEEIPKLLGKLEEGYDVVYGKPYRKEHGFWRDVASVITKLVLKSMMKIDSASQVGPFRGFKTKLRDAFADFRGPHVSLDVMLTWGTLKFSCVTVQHEPRKIGRSNYTFRRLIGHAIDIITGFSSLPLRIASLMGFLFMFVGVVIQGYVLWIYFMLDNGVPGFSFLASIIAIFAGVQLFSLGIIGEYIGRMHQRMLDRPSYVVLEKTDNE